MCPRIVPDVGPPQLTQGDLADLYNKGIHPAVLAVLPEQIPRWPPSYASALSLSRDTRSQLHYATLDIPAGKVAAFGEALRQNLANHPRLKDAFFMIEKRGTKGMFTFDYASRATSARIPWDKFVGDIDIGDVDEEQNFRGGGWYCDIGVEVRRPGHVLHWLEESHAILLQKALPLLGSEGRRILQGKPRQFQVDVAAHIFRLAGFRCSPGTKGHTDKVSHVNVYTTDKAVTYQLHHGSFSAHSPTDLYPQKIGNLVKDVDKMAMMFFDCTQGSVQDGAARFEVRVQAWRAHEALPEFDEEDLRNCIVCLPSQVWW